MLDVVNLNWVSFYTTPKGEITEDYYSKGCENIPKFAYQRLIKKVKLSVCLIN
jgi:hypothetical protein